MTGLEQVYLGCFIAGLGYSVFAAFTSGMFGGHDVDVAADFDADHGFGGDGHDAGMGGDYDPDVSFSPLSPVVISTFVCTFGGVGLMGTQMFHLGYLSILPATPAGFLVAGFVFYLFNKLFSMTQGSSEVHVVTLQGKSAEVILAIPGDGMGEITYSAKGSRYNAAARSISGMDISKNSLVVIDKIVGSTFYVKPHVDEELRKVNQENEE